MERDIIGPSNHAVPKYEIPEDIKDMPEGVYISVFPTRVAIQAHLQYVSEIDPKSRTIRQDLFPYGGPGGCIYKGKPYIHGVRAIVSTLKREEILEWIEKQDVLKDYIP